MLGLRQKLSLGFAGLLAIIVIIGAQSVMLFSQLGDSLMCSYERIIAV